MRPSDYGQRRRLARRYDAPSGGRLNVPRTPVARLVLAIKLRRLKIDHLRRRT